MSALLGRRPRAVVSRARGACRYAFHAGLQHAWLKRAIRFWQYVQLLGGASLALLAFGARVRGSSSCRGAAGVMGVASELVPAALFLGYFVLFQGELSAEAVADLGMDRERRRKKERNV